MLYYSIHEGRLLVCANHIINLYEINQDPRTIMRLVNGISNNHLEPAVGLHRLSDKLFAVATPY